MGWGVSKVGDTQFSIFLYILSKVFYTCMLNTCVNKLSRARVEILGGKCFLLM